MENQHNDHVSLPHTHTHPVRIQIVINLLSQSPFPTHSHSHIHMDTKCLRGPLTDGERVFFGGFL